MAERDKIARIIGVGAVVIGGALVVDRIVDRQIQPPQGITAPVPGGIDMNLLGDCINENVLRSIVGEPPINYWGCLEERQGWLDRLLQDHPELPGSQG